jgi:8-oxo-dGTP pyrophosphatase MutT (NUDIX family)
MSRPEHDPANPWQTLSSRPVYQNPWIKVREDQVLQPDGRPGIYGVVEFQNRAVGVLAIDDDHVWLVGQYRYPLGLYSWEIPEGGCPPNEPLEACARRELQEETGLTCERLEPLVTSHLSNSVSNEWGIVYRAIGLIQGPSSPDGTERLEVKRVPFRDALDMVHEGTITDSLSVIALLHEAARRGPSRRRRLSLTILTIELAIARLASEDDVPASLLSSPFCSITRTPDELSIVASAELVSSGARIERGFRALRVHGPFVLTETGVLSSLLDPLARAAIPVFAVSTFDTDFLLVRQGDLDCARQALVAAGHNVEG